MNEQERSELERLKQRQTRLAQELAQLATQLNLLEQRLDLHQPEASAQVAARDVLKVGTPPEVQHLAKEAVSIPSALIPPVISPVPVIARDNVPPVATTLRLR